MSNLDYTEDVQLMATIQNVRNDIMDITEILKDYRDELDNTVEKNEILIKINEIQNLFSLKGHTHSGYAASQHSHPELLSKLNVFQEELDKLVKKVPVIQERVIEKQQQVVATECVNLTTDLKRLEEMLLQEKKERKKGDETPHARQHVMGKDQIPLATSKRRGLMSALQVRTLDYVLKSKGVKVFAGGGASSSVTNILSLIAYRAEPADSEVPLNTTYPWMSNGTGEGNDGDIMIKINSNGTIKTATLVPFSLIS